MDIEELDEWLGTDHDRTGGSGSASPDPPQRWDNPPPRRQDLTDGRQQPPSGRRRWMVIGGVAAVLWLTVMLLVATGRQQTGVAPVATGPTALLEGQPDPAVTLTDTTGMAAAPADPTAPDAALPAAVAPPAGDPTITSPPDQNRVQLVDGGPVQAGAILALRASLSASADGQPRYLEWAIPIQRSPIADEVDLVVLDAVWLQGTDGTYDRAERGLWAVPVRLDGVALAVPWAVASAPPPQAPDQVVPLLRHRPAEVEDALTNAGWSNLVVHASEAHPDLPGTWLAVVDGTDPAGVARTGSLLWLRDDVPMHLLGAQS